MNATDRGPGPPGTAPNASPRHTTSPPPEGEAHAMRELGVSLLINAVAPIVVYYGLRAAGLEPWLALLLGLIPPAVKTTHTVLTTRRLDPLGALVLGALVLSVAMSFTTGSPRALLARDGLITGVIGLWMIFTITRPTPYYLFALLTFTRGRLRAEIEAAWHREPAFRRMVHRGTAMWGSALLVDALSTVVLAYTAPIDSVPLIGALKLIGLIVLAEVASQVHFRLTGMPHLDLADTPTSEGTHQ